MSKRNSPSGVIRTERIEGPDSTAATTDATPTETVGSRYLPAENSSEIVELVALAQVDTDDTDIVRVSREFAVTRDDMGTTSVAVNGAADVFDPGGSGLTPDLEIVVDAGTQEVFVQVTGDAATNVNWRVYSVRDPLFNAIPA